jgi:hypothetical protein
LGTMLAAVQRKILILEAWDWNINAEIEIKIYFLDWLLKI